MLHGLRVALRPVEVREPSVERGFPGPPQHPHRLDCLVGARAAILERRADRLGFLAQPADADAEQEAPVRERVDRRALLRADHGAALREDQHAGAQPEPLGDAGQERKERERVGEIVVLDREAAFGVVRVARRVLRGDHRVLEGPDRLEAGLLGRLGVRRDRVRRRQEMPVARWHDAEAHAADASRRYCRAMSSKAGTRRDERVITPLRIVGLVATVVALYLLAPSIARAFSEFPRLRELDPVWMGASLVMEAASFVSLWWLLTIVLRTRKWFAVATSQLASNAVSRAIGAGAFVIVVGLGALLLFTDRPLAAVGRAIQWLINRMPWRKTDVTQLPTRLRRERNRVRKALGRTWWQALLASVGKWALDYFALLAALAAVGTQANPVLILLAYTASAVLTMIPITPGGLGFVEAGLTAMLVLAGVDASDAILATLDYRLVSFWLPLPAGAIAAWLFRRRVVAAT